MKKEKDTLRSPQESRVTTSKKGMEEIKESLQCNPRYMSTKEKIPPRKIPSPEESGVTTSRRGELDFIETPKGKIPAITLDPEYDTLNTLWSAEKNYYLLYCINQNGEMFNKYVLPLRESRLKKPIPKFRTLTAFLEWVEDTNPKAVKEILRDVLLMMSNNDRGIILPDEGGVADNDRMGEYYKGLSRYMTEHVLVLSNEFTRVYNGKPQEP